MEKKRYQPSALRLIRWLLEDKTFDILTDNGFTDLDFFGNGKQALDFVKEYFGEYSEFPAIDVVEEETKISFPKETARGYAIKAFRKHLKTKQISKLNEKSLDFLAKNDPDAAEEVLIVGLAEISPTDQGESFKETAQDRFDAYLQAKKDGLSGVIPCYPSLASAIGVYKDGTHSAILGVTNSGKSWICCEMARFAAYGGQKAKVLFVSMENSSNSIEGRLDALYHKIPFGDILSKQVDMRQEQGWKENVPSLEKESGDIIIVDETSIKTVGDIYQAYLTLKPDFILVDGAYRLFSSRGGEGHDKSTNVIDDLHHFAALSNIPWVSTSQLNAGAMNSAGGREMAFEARFSKMWLMSPDCVICLVNSPEDILMDICTCYIAKQRDSGDMTGKKTVFKIKADRLRMDYGELLEDYYDEDIMQDTL